MPIVERTRATPKQHQVVAMMKAIAATPRTEPCQLEIIRVQHLRARQQRRASVFRQISPVAPVIQVTRQVDHPVDKKVRLEVQANLKPPERDKKIRVR